MTEYVDEVRARQRAARHATSFPLLLTAAATAFLAVAEGRGWWLYPQVLVPAATYAALYVVMLVQRRATGIGTGRDGYGLVAVACALVGFLVPVVALFLGAAFVLGGGLVVLGWRGRDAWLVGPGLALMVVGPLGALGTLANHAAFLGPEPSVLVLGVLAGALLVLAGLALARERRARTAGRAALVASA
ncbi:hypothetical protein [Cellulosimicrobium cellulans]|uniref:hypothetical protein n=1 Tax=Cellulosimicrobium cellulans TaxID=1710 RepID=UPI0012FD300C|nr:hypothetical protein [Cellulosimicrobium cellulans]